MRYHLVQRSILTQAQTEIDFPHGFFGGFGPRHPAAAVSVSGSLHSSSRLSYGKLAMPIMTPAFKWSAELLSQWKCLSSAGQKVYLFLQLFTFLLWILACLFLFILCRNIIQMPLFFPFITFSYVLVKMLKSSPKVLHFYKDDEVVFLENLSWRGFCGGYASCWTHRFDSWTAQNAPLMQTLILSKL